MEVDRQHRQPTEAADVDMEEDEENKSKRMRVLTINALGQLKKVRIGKKNEETEILLNEELEQLAHRQDTPLDPEATLRGIKKEAESLKDFNVYEEVPLTEAPSTVHQMGTEGEGY